jgi:SAM-dependent methyltransferase
MPPKFTNITETPGANASQEQIERLYQRYRFARDYCSDRDVLEAACGAGQGLGYLATHAKSVVGCDIDEECLSFARKHYVNRKGVHIDKADAQSLPYPDATFDVVLLFEAIYYLPEPAQFVTEAKRVMRPKGNIIICTVNREWQDFNPSPYSVRYFSVTELADLLKEEFEDIRCYGGFPVSTGSLKDITLSLIRRTAITLRLIPRTLKGRERLKRIFMGRLTPIPFEIADSMCQYHPPSPIPDKSPNRTHKELFVVGRRA